jgi:hemoglobin-like flavoprotein
MTTSDFLRESITLVEGKADEVARLFYARLLDVAPHLAPLFPRDLVDPDSPQNPVFDDLAGEVPAKTGRQQRDLLVGALVALGSTYDPHDREKMDALRTALSAYGRSHSAFQRPDGTVQGATLDEYAAVKSILLPTLAEVAGDGWLPVYSAAWAEAYDFAAGHMLVAAFEAAFAAPQRTVRPVRRR